MSCENGYKISLLFIGFEDVNGTHKPVFEPHFEECNKDAGPIVISTFLTIIFVLALVSNIMLLVTIATSYTLKKHLHSYIVMSLCVVCMLDCGLNISVAIGYVSTKPWRFGYVVCYLSSFAINILNSQMAFSILYLTSDRTFVVRKYVPYLTLSKLKLNIFILISWVIAFLMALPLGVAVIKSMPYQRRYSCSVADEYDDYYLIAHFCLVLTLPTVLMVVCGCIIALTFHRERRKHKKNKGTHTFSYLDQILMTPYYRNEFHSSLFVILLVIFYIILWLPFTTVSILTPMLTTDWKNNTAKSASDGPFSAQSLVRSSKSLLTTSFNMTNTTNMDDIIINEDSLQNKTAAHNLNFIPEFVTESIHEEIFVWFHFVFDLVVPVLAFATMNNVRIKCEGLLLCFRAGSRDVASPKPVYHPRYDRLSKRGSKGTLKSKNSKNMVSLKTPILFATSEGIHVRTVEKSFLELYENKRILDFSKSEDISNHFVYDLCDVSLEREGEWNAETLGDKDQVAFDPRKSLEEDIENDGLRVQGTARPPTPPKPATSESFDDLDEIKLRNRTSKKKNKKFVHFDTSLNREIPSVDSSPVSSANPSSRSNDSGILADNEHSASYSKKQDATRKIRQKMPRSSPMAKGAPKTQVKPGLRRAAKGRVVKVSPAFVAKNSQKRKIKGFNIKSRYFKSPSSDDSNGS